ncbi:MAG TPA: nickel-dependent lactate racemase, partial [Spirochaetes bacterium]|nr:nickel-dependent lactate racemase [Spirochaetota bacterium]
VDDNTRPTPAHRFFHLVVDALIKAGASPRNMLLMPALGIHTPMTDAEMAEKVGVNNLKKIPWENHQAFDRDKNHFFGKTRRGTPVWLNKRLAEADLTVTIGMVEPHLWAGYGGGYKNLLPGIAHAETIGAHHGILAEPPYHFNRVGMKPEMNSFRTDLEDIKDLIHTPVFCLNVAIDHNKRVLAAFAGDPIACHREAVEFNIRSSGLSLPRQVDAIIVNSNPMDINFKQSMKCVGNSLPALKPGGVIIGFLRAERGMDDIIVPEKATPLRVVKTILRLLGPSRVMGFLEKVRKGLNVEEKFLLYYSMQLMRQYDLYFHVPSITPEEVKRVGFFVHSYDPQEIVNIAAKKIGKKADIALFPSGGATFPIVG